MHASSAAWGASVGLKRWATPKVSPRCRPPLTESKILSHVDIAHRKVAQPLKNQLASGEALVRGKWGGASESTVCYIEYQSSPRPPRMSEKL